MFLMKEWFQNRRNLDADLFTDKINLVAFKSVAFIVFQHCSAL